MNYGNNKDTLINYVLWNSADCLHADESNNDYNYSNGVLCNVNVEVQWKWKWNDVNVYYVYSLVNSKFMR